MQLSSAQRFVGHPESSRWLQLAGKLGYAVKGVVYAVVGVLALQVAFGAGGRLGGEQEAVEHIGRQPFGAALLVATGVGLLAYALWKLIEAVMDTQHRGSSGKGILARAAAFGSGLMNGAVGVLALQLAFGQSGGGGGPKTWAASLLEEPWGLAVLGLLGIFVTGIGIHHVYSGFTDKFTERLQLSTLPRARRSWVLWSGRVGYVARGVIFAMIGVALLRAAVTTNPGNAKGFGEALQDLASQPFGQAVLIAVACGLLAYGIHLVTTVPYRRLIG